MSSSFPALHGVSSQIPSLKFFRVDCEPSFSEPNSKSDSYFLVVANPILVFFKPVEIQFFRLVDITLHHQLVSLTGVSVVGPKIYSFSILWVLLNAACVPDFLICSLHYHLYIPSFFIFLYIKNTKKS